MRSELYRRLMNAREWKELRAEVLRAHPLCERCSQAGYVSAASCVHHIQPVETAATPEDARRLAYSRDNLQALCRKCHSEVHSDRQSHTKANHQQREEERLQQWAERHRRTEKPAGG